MPILRLAYATQFLIALVAVFDAWSQIGGQDPLDVLPWYVKLVLACAAAFATVKATAAAVADKRAWNARTRKWFGILVITLLMCGLATYYAQLFLETDQDNQDTTDESAQISTLRPKGSLMPLLLHHRAAVTPSRGLFLPAPGPQGR